MDPTPPFLTAPQHLALNLAPDLPHSSSQTGTALSREEQLRDKIFQVFLITILLMQDYL